MVNRDKKLKYNTLAALINQVITIVCGFILPRFYLKCYGSQVYGLVSSISQFLGFVTLMELGMGAVVQSALYAPLAQKDNITISKIVISAERFFRRIAMLFLLYTIVLLFVYPNYIQNKFSWWFEASLILIIAISSLAEYFFGITYRLLLMADQAAFVTLGLQSIGLLLNFVVCIVLMKVGASIQIVKLVSSIVLLIRPIGQNIFVKKKYDIDKKIILTDEPIKQKWNGIAQHIAYYVTNNTDTIVLSVMSTLENVSVYSVYNMVVSGIKQLVLTLNTGVQSLFGNMLAKNEIDELSSRFKVFEWRMHSVVTILFSCVAILIIPFVMIYTKGIEDANYRQPLFALLMAAAQAAYCIRLPYNTMVCAAGHYKETQRSAIIEMLLNLSITIILVSKVGLVGVAIGTFVALAYRTIYLAHYIAKGIIDYSFISFWKNLTVDVMVFIISYCISTKITFVPVTYIEWVIMALVVFALVIAVYVLINLCFYRDYLLALLRSSLIRRNK